MAKGVVALVSVFVLLAVVHSNADEFTVEGEVYCDPCRVKFKTELAKPLPGSKVLLECRNIETNKMTYEVKGEADKDGKYSLKVEGDHQDDICEVSPFDSPDDACKETMGESEKAKIECSKNTGMSSDVRYANPVGFMTTKVEEKCKKLIEDMGLEIVDGVVKGLAEDDQEKN